MIISSGNNEDHLLAIALGSGDQQALSKLYDKYAPALTGIINRIIGNHTKADEILQRIFHHVWNEAGSFDSSKYAVFTWLIKITRQAAIDTVRSTQVEGQATFLQEYKYTFEKNEVVGSAVPVEMQMFDLLYHKGLTCTEAATALKLPADEIKRQVRQAIKNMEYI